MANRPQLSHTWTRYASETTKSRSCWCLVVVEAGKEHASAIISSSLLRGFQRAKTVPRKGVIVFVYVHACEEKCGCVCVCMYVYIYICVCVCEFSRGM